jgi:hypothetical protein
MVEIADVFRRHGPAYRAKYGDRMPPSHRVVMQAIEHCRTEVLGGQVYYCDECDEALYSYHSCKNRHCPKCQNDAAQDWLERQQDLLLPVPYFMLTFTLPEGLRAVARSNQKCVYNLLFRTSAAATQELAQDPRFVGGKIGMIGVLQTWARDLTYHPHVHFLVPGGGLAPDGESWRSARDTFLVPVKPLAILFRAKFRDALRETDLFDQVPAEVWTQDWVVHCQPVGEGVTALKYLAPYIFRVAISNNRILRVEDGTVTFRYTASDTGETRYCTLTVEEFIRRFLQHVLPKGFVKVRYYGLFSSGNRSSLTQVRLLLGSAANPQLTQHLSTETAPPDRPQCCPQCGRPMVLWKTIQPAGRSPPG